MIKPQAISASSLSIGYQKGRFSKIVFSDIELTLRSGELVCIIGPNGIGKSTLIRTLAGLHSFISGEISVFGKNLNLYKRTDLATRMSIVLTGKVPTGNLTVYELVSLGRYPYLNWMGNPTEQDQNRITWALEATQTTELASQRLYEISDGQLQKVMIARALAQDTEIILLDEPTAHLDLSNRIAIFKLLRELSENTGKAILIATHELELSFQVADRLILMKKNMPLLSGTPEDLILAGEIGSFFNHVSVDFDIHTGKFLPKKDFTKKVNLTGSGPEKFWTKNALERNNYFTADDTSDITIIVKTLNNGICWEILFRDEIITVHSINELLSFLTTI